MRVGLVFGGNTSEGEISRLSAEGVRGALQKNGHEVVNIEFDKNAAIHIQDANVDVVFNAMHGQYGEDGCLQGLLNVMQIPYTHSGVLASAIGMDKVASNFIFNSLGIQTIRGFTVTKQELYTDQWKKILKNSKIAECKELFIKPVRGGSSKDTFLIKNIEDFSFKTVDLSTSGDLFLVEERIVGHEMQVAVLDNKVIGALEVIVNSEISEFYDYTAKYTKNGAFHKQVFEENNEVVSRMFRYTEKIHKTLGLNCISRSEFIVTDDGKIYVLEVNTHPGLTPLSIVPEIAQNVGISYEQIVDILLRNARFES